MIDWDQVEVLTFDCYGTLIDWETGILNALQPILLAHQIILSSNEILELYGELETKAEQPPFQAYHDVLKTVLRGFGEQLGFSPTSDELEQFANSVGNWLPFPDTVAALKRLKTRYRLAVLSNIDDDLFAMSVWHLQVEFDWVITAQQVGSYKPARENFEAMLACIDVPKEKILHIAQSLYHDIIPTNDLDINNVWVNRRGGKEGHGATAPAMTTPDYEVPDLQTLVNMMFGS